MRLTLALLVVAGCYSPSPPEGIACGDGMTCPADMTCSFGTCVSEVPPCIPIEGGLGQLTVPRLEQDLTVDGDLSDWPTCFVSIDPTSAGLVRDLGAGGRFASGRFSIAADGRRLHVVAEVQSVLPLGDQPPPDVYLNNAISVYFDGDGKFETAIYGDDAAQIVVDHANRTQAFRSGNGGVVSVPDVVSAAQTTASTFTIELGVSPATFGLAEFGRTIGFDIGLVGGDGEVMTSELVWFQACTEPVCGCENGDSAPFCDARQFGIATIGP